MPPEGDGHHRGQGEEVQQSHTISNGRMVSAVLLAGDRELGKKPQWMKDEPGWPGVFLSLFFPSLHG